MSSAQALAFNESQIAGFCKELTLDLAILIFNDP